MGFLRRREPAGPAAELPLSTFQVRRLHQLVGAAFRDAGLRLETRGDHVVDDRGRGFGLRDLAAECATEPVGRWPELVRRHVRAHASPHPTLDQLTDHTLATRSVLRVLPAASIPPDWEPAGAPLTDELTDVVSVDLGTEVLTPSAAALAERDPDRDWRALGADNLQVLATELPVHHERVEPDDEHPVGSGAGSGFEVVVGESGLTASLGLAMEPLLARLGLRDRGRGVLVGMPYRHQLLVRVVDGSGARAAVRRMADYARSTFAVAPGPVTPRIHWVHQGTWRPVTRAGEAADEARSDLPDPLDPEVAAELEI